MKKKFCRRLLSLALTGMAFLAQSQNPLKIGDALPKQFWETPLQMVNTPQKTTTLSADKDKLIILDFWNTWCSACILNFPKMEELQKQFGDKIKILAVSNQDRATLEKFFASKNGSKYNQVQSVAADKTMQMMFPHIGVPFIVWIKGGKLLNTTDAEQVNEKTINELLDGRGTSSLQTVIQRNDDGPLMTTPDLQLEKGFTLGNYVFFGKGRMRGLGYGTRFHRSGAVIHGRQFTNLSISEIYRVVAGELFEKRGDIFTDKRMMMELRDENAFTNPKNSNASVNDQYLYSFDFIIPQSQAGSLYELMFSQLNQMSGYHASIEKRVVSCFALVRTSPADKLVTKGGPEEFRLRPMATVIKNSSMYKVVNSLNGFAEIKLPIVDETGYTGNLDLQMGDISTLEKLRIELSRYNLDLIEKQKSLDMLVIRDANQ